MRYSPDEELDIMKEIWSPRLRDNPENYVKFSYPWGKKGTPLENKKGPRQWQLKILRLVTQHIEAHKGREIDFYEVLKVATASGRGIGKSAEVAWLGDWFVKTRIGGTVIICANSETQLRSVTFGEISKWHEMSITSHWFDLVGMKMTPAKWFSEIVSRDLGKGLKMWGIEGKLWSEEKPDSFVGVHNHDGLMVIFDEASGIADQIWTVTQGFFTEQIVDRYWFAFSNPRREEGYFYDCFNGPQAVNWITENIDARTVEDTDKKLYDEIIGDDPNSRAAHIEVYGQFFPGGSEQFISTFLVKAASSREFIYGDTDEPVVIGIDPGGSGDETGLIVRRGRTVLYSSGFVEGDSEACVTKLGEFLLEWKPDLVVIDTIGLGFHLSGRLKAFGFKTRGFIASNKANELLRWGNRRAEVWGAMRDWLMFGCIPSDATLMREIGSPRRKEGSRDKAPLIESKADMKKRGVDSPNRADALAMTFAFPVNKREKRVVVSNRDPMVYMGNSHSWLSA